MDNIIKKKSDVFILQGKINSSTTNQLITHLEYLLCLNKELTINIDKVTNIDEKGILALFHLQVYALRYNYSFAIVGKGSRDIYNEFKYKNVA